MLLEQSEKIHLFFENNWEDQMYAIFIGNCYTIIIPIFSKEVK